MGTLGLFHWLIIGVIVLGSLGVVAAVVFLVVRAAKAAPPMRGPNLDSCPDCGQMVSRLAKACPHCGRPLQS